MDEGWIKIHRKMEEKFLPGNFSLMGFAVFLIMRANIKDRKFFMNGREVLVKRGQYLTGRKKLSALTGHTERELRTFLANLQILEFVTIESTNHYSIITICNYDKYQGRDYKNDQQNDQRPTNDRPTTDHILRREEGNNQDIRAASPPSTPIQKKKSDKKSEVLDLISDETYRLYQTAYLERLKKDCPHRATTWRSALAHRKIEELEVEKIRQAINGWAWQAWIEKKPEYGSPAYVVSRAIMVDGVRDYFLENIQFYEAHRNPVPVVVKELT